jgi:hypothetical protein
MSLMESLMHGQLLARPWEITEPNKDADNTNCSKNMGMEFS